MNTQEEKKEEVLIAKVVYPQPSDTFDNISLAISSASDWIEEGYDQFNSDDAILFESLMNKLVLKQINSLCIHERDKRTI